MSKTSKVTRAGQITIPKQLREQHHLQEGDVLEFQVVRDGILIKPLVERTAAKRLMQDVVEKADAQIRDKKYTTVHQADDIDNFVDDL